MRGADNVGKSISPAPVADPPRTGTTRIRGGGRTLMPAVIDTHTDVMFSIVPQATMLLEDIGFVHIVSAKSATDTLMRGFTSVRDLGGPSLGLKKSYRRGHRRGGAPILRARSCRSRAATATSACRASCSRSARRRSS